jgi:hypothetical protein
VAVDKELARGGAHRHSCARDLAMVARGARGGDGDPYPGWHEAAEGLGRSGVGEGTWRQSVLNKKVLGARR